MNKFGLPALLMALLLCSCATTRQPTPIVPASELPADVTMNEDAGRGSLLFVKVRLESGEEVPLAVDTGSSFTIFDKSFDSKLGQRLGTITTPVIGAKKKLTRFTSPKLYLGSTRLVTGDYVYTSDYLSEVSSNFPFRVLGVLGLDCLKHYRIQMDFEERKMRFLNSDQVKPAELGKAFPLSLEYLALLHQPGPVTREGHDWWMIDTGCNIDGLLCVPLFPAGKESRISARKQPARNVNVFFPKCVWNDNNYSRLLIGTGVDLIGVRFLARHLVTFDFPNRTMYLKQKSIGPLPNDFLNDQVTDALIGPRELLRNLKESGQLPGCSREKEEELFCVYHPEGDSNSYIFAYREEIDSETRHYRVGRLSKDAPWKLEAAWRTDQNDHVIEQYALP